jgi:hypothetical protein
MPSFSIPLCRVTSFEKTQILGVVSTCLMRRIDLASPNGAIALTIGFLPSLLNQYNRKKRCIPMSEFRNNPTIDERLIKPGQ